MTRLGAGRVLVGGRLHEGDVEVRDGLVDAITEPTRGSTRIVAPGYVDLQVNGFAGVDFAACTVEALVGAADALVERGTTAFCPTLVTAPVDRTCGALAVIGDAREARSSILGAHLEGPFLSPARLGAHDGAHRLDPDVAILDALTGAGPVARMTLAPELPGALDMVATLLARRIRVAAGHSDATGEEAHRGFDAGVDSVTHLGNAMAPFHQRSPALFGAALTRDDVTPTIIADGQHLAPDTVRLVFAATQGRVALVSDAVAAAGPPRRAGTAAARDSRGDLVGGLLTLAETVPYVADLGIDPAKAIGAAAVAPRRLALLPHDDGIQPGQPADLVVLDDALGLLETIRSSRSAQRRHPS